LHTLSTTFVLGYHGCDRSVAEELLAGEAFRPSDNDYDWLGHGIYFWESNPARALDFTKDIKSRSATIETPYVVGAVIDLGYCLDLTSTSGINAVEKGYESFAQMMAASGSQMPKNSGGPDLLLRKLDCAVINHIHASLKNKHAQPLDTVRGVFIEGGQIYENSGFYRKTHIQICVSNSASIKGVFRLPKEQLREIGLA
jgi:hypothetical protein